MEKQARDLKQLIEKANEKYGGESSEVAKREKTEEKRRDLPRPTHEKEGVEDRKKSSTNHSPLQAILFLDLYVLPGDRQPRKREKVE